MLIYKVCKVIESCETLDQLEVAEEYLKRVKYYLTQYEREATRLVFEIKENELEDE